MSIFATATAASAAASAKKLDCFFTHFVFPHFSHLTVRIEHFRVENRIPDAQLYHFPAGMVWNHEVESRHIKLVFLNMFF